MRYSRISLKVSGEALSGERGFWFYQNVIGKLSCGLKNMRESGVKLSWMIVAISSVLN
ncbi:hypothetical protein [Anaplasma phagocytophilum]|uniref:hypothetical protein n=1 Tax=Anaplasma phagocytophilum TaxID=948 RepID=UPI0007E0ABF9|nr:hypothetical protein [Anaplasma phagocytophilum]SBO31478.1 hypothetical protein ANAPC3_00543 [Anaplasma phagocytophilum]